MSTIGGGHEGEALHSVEVSVRLDQHGSQERGHAGWAFALKHQLVEILEWLLLEDDLDARLGNSNDSHLASSLDVKFLVEETLAADDRLDKESLL